MGEICHFASHAMFQGGEEFQGNLKARLFVQVFCNVPLFQAVKGYKKEWGVIMVFWLLPDDQGAQMTHGDLLESGEGAWS
jgi:hypothetical protein